MPNNLPVGTLQKYLVTNALWGGLAGAICWVILLIHAAASFDTYEDRVTAAVNCGPLVLSHLSKHTITSGGYGVTMSFAPGLLWFLLAWIMLGTAVGSLLLWRKRSTATLSISASPSDQP
jgi:hypothetical protein